jgi:protease I
MWDLSLDPIPVMGTGKCNAVQLEKADPKKYDAIVVMGGHSADVMVTEEKVTNFIKAASDNGAVLGAIGAGTMPYIRAGLMKGKKATGDAAVDFMIKKIGTFVDAPVATDGKLITAKDTVDTPAFVRELCKAFDPSFNDARKGAMAGKRVLIIAGEDFEDIELCVPAMEYIYRGAKVTCATFDPPMKSRPALLGLNVVQGNFGMTVPFQEIPMTYYSMKPLSKVAMDEFDVVQIPGAFCPWNITFTPSVLEFLKKANAAGKIMAYICHGSIPMAKADLVKGKKIAGWLACIDAVTIMGGEHNWDWAATVDGTHVTGRTPPEIPEFVDAICVALELNKK